MVVDLEDVKLSLKMPPKRYSFLWRIANNNGIVLTEQTLRIVAELAGDRCWLTTIPKVKHSTFREAKVALGDQYQKRVYPCPSCDYWHVGSFHEGLPSNVEHLGKVDEDPAIIEERRRVNRAEARRRYKQGLRDRREAAGLSRNGKTPLNKVQAPKQKKKAKSKRRKLERIKRKQLGA